MIDLPLYIYIYIYIYIFFFFQIIETTPSDPIVFFLMNELRSEF
jgi:hypothetical protein